eukprot:1869277-Amphidinium_carterae.1
MPPGCGHAIDLLHAFLAKTLHSTGRQVQVRKCVDDMVLVAKGCDFAGHGTPLKVKARDLGLIMLSGPPFVIMLYSHLSAGHDASTTGVQQRALLQVGL